MSVAVINWQVSTALPQSRIKSCQRASVTKLTFLSVLKFYNSSQWKRNLQFWCHYVTATEISMPRTEVPVEWLPQRCSMSDDACSRKTMIVLLPQLAFCCRTYLIWQMLRVISDISLSHRLQVLREGCPNCTLPGPECTSKLAHVPPS
jgi:hypothetical protein